MAKLLKILGSGSQIKARTGYLKHTTIYASGFSLEGLSFAQKNCIIPIKIEQLV